VLCIEDNSRAVGECDQVNLHRQALEQCKCIGHTKLESQKQQNLPYELIKKKQGTGLKRRACEKAAIVDTP
jgi:hypothetical protein